MHITQTYLGRTSETGLFCYYLFEDYNQEQQRLTQKVQDALDDVGADYMEDIDLFRPNERYAGNIAREVREIKAIWDYCSDQLPGFLVTYKPLIKVDPKQDSVIFFSIKGRSEQDALDVVRKIRTLTQESFRSGREQVVARADTSGFGERFLEALEIKPRFMGVALDLKKLIRRH
jgi:hypothetical protein